MADESMPRPRRKRARRQWGYDSRGLPFSIACLPMVLLIGLLIAIPLLMPAISINVSAIRSSRADAARARGWSTP